MAKRYIDTGLFDDDWFMDLSKDSKLLYIYLITKCSHAGLIKLNERLCKVQTGITDIKGALEGLKSRLIGAQEGLLFMPKFLYFQYPKFPQSKVYQQKAALDELTKYGLFKNGKLAPQEGLFSPFVNVDVDVNAAVNVNANVKEELIFPFDSDEFLKWWGYWKEYKHKEFKFKYASSISEQATLKELSGLAGGNEETAIKIIEQSMAKNWKGLFELKQNHILNPAAREELRKEVAKKYFGS